MERQHVVPLNDMREHEPSPDCWCRPCADEECALVLVHNSLQRDAYAVAFSGGLAVFRA